MGHTTSKSYKKLQQRLDRHAQGAPESDTLYDILEVLFSADEAELVSKLPFRFCRVSDAAERWGCEPAVARARLDTLADKGLMLDLKNGDEHCFILAPTMAGFFEFSLMRLDGRFDKRLLSELFHKYINEEDAFVRQIFGLRVPIDRVFVQEETLHQRDHSEILDYERASEVINTATHISVGTCYCRHKMQHMGEACRAPQDVCLTFNSSAESLIRHGIAKEISRAQAHDVLQRSIKHGLVQIGDNVQSGVNWICNCCGCCCEAILAYKRLGYTADIDSNYVVAHDDVDACAGCGACAKRCPLDAIAERGQDDDAVALDRDRCFGCGVCVRACKRGALQLERRDAIKFVPKDSFERCIVNAIDAGKLQNYVFDNDQLWSHAALRRLLAVLVKLPPIKQIMANRQLQSRFVDGLRRSQFHEVFEETHDDPASRGELLKEQLQSRGSGRRRERV